MKAILDTVSCRWRSDFRRKSVAFSLLLVSTISAVAIIYFPARQEQHAVEVIQEKAEYIADMTAQAIGSAMYSENIEDIEKALLVASHKEDLIYVSVMDISGRLVASRNNNPDNTINVTEFSDDPISANGHVYNVMSPVIVDDEEIGRVYMGFSLEEMRLEISRSRTFIALIVCLILVIHIVSVLSISKVINNHFEKAAGDAKQIAKDETTPRSTVFSNVKEGYRERSSDQIIDSIELMKHVTEGHGQILSKTTEQLKQEIALRKEMESNLLTAMEVADETVAAKVEFLRNISHELRTPMTTVISSTELLLKTRINAEQRELLDILKTASASMMLLITNLLDMAKIVAQELILELSVFRLRGNIENCLRAFDSDAHKKDIKLSCDIHPSVPDWVIGDDYRLLQVLNNLISNAIKFTEQGEVRLRVIEEHGESESPDVDSDRVRLHFSVSDTGIGLSPSKVDQIFDSFHQSEGSMVHDVAGVGLGLAITKKLIELMDGRIWVESQKGKGSTFHFIVNFKRFESIGEEKNLESPTDSQLSSESVSLRHQLLQDGRPSLREDQKIKVLLTENDPEKQELISVMLKQHGYLVEIASTSIEAVEALDSNKYDVVLIDIQMSELDGRETLKIIQQNEKQYGGRVPIIALGARSIVTDRKQCYRMQMDDYVGMPVQPEELCNVIESVLALSRTK
ncbi:MAG: response regulator [bacterium]|nr:MAG: response regulator [bacterium]